MQVQPSDASTPARRAKRMKAEVEKEQHTYAHVNRQNFTSASTELLFGALLLCLINKATCTSVVKMSVHVCLSLTPWLSRSLTH